MKVKLTYCEPVTKVVDIPKDMEFWFKKHEVYYTDEEWDRMYDWVDNVGAEVLRRRGIIVEEAEIEDFWD